MEFVQGVCGAIFVGKLKIFEFRVGTPGHFCNLQQASLSLFSPTHPLA